MTRWAWGRSFLTPKRRLFTIAYSLFVMEVGQGMDGLAIGAVSPATVATKELIVRLQQRRVYKGT